MDHNANIFVQFPSLNYFRELVDQSLHKLLATTSYIQPIHPHHNQACPNNHRVHEP